MAINLKKANVDVMTQVVKGFQAVNAPRPNAVAVACAAIATTAQKAAKIDGLTPFGHKAACKGGIIDTVILSGNVHSLESFVTALMNSGINNVKADIQQYGLTDTLQAILAKRVTDHVSWCANTLNESHKGYGSRLAKTGLAMHRAEIAGNLTELAELLKNQFNANYAKLYKNR